MKMYIWEWVGGVTDNWHPEGGLLVIAEDLERARVLIEEGTSTHETSEKEALYTEPDLVYDVEASEEKLVIFPDAGCC